MRWVTSSNVLVLRLFNYTEVHGLALTVVNAFNFIVSAFLEGIHIKLAFLDLEKQTYN